MADGATNHAGGRVTIRTVAADADVIAGKDTAVSLVADVYMVTVIAEAAVTSVTQVGVNRRRKQRRRKRRGFRNAAVRAANSQ